MEETMYWVLNTILRWSYMMNWCYVCVVCVQNKMSFNYQCLICLES